MSSEATADEVFPTVEPPINMEIVLDDSKIDVYYTNFCRITATLEEVIVDAGFNTQATLTAGQSIALDRRTVMTFHTAKRLLAALQMTIERHEARLGPIENQPRT